MESGRGNGCQNRKGVIDDENKERKISVNYESPALKITNTEKGSEHDETGEKENEAKENVGRRKTRK